MTTVGYGDLHPSTDGGRVIAIGVMVVGIGFLSLLIGAVSERFVTGGMEEEVAELQRGVEHDLDVARAELVGELRAMSERLRELKLIVGRLGGGRTGP